MLVSYIIYTSIKECLFISHGTFAIHQRKHPYCAWNSKSEQAYFLSVCVCARWYISMSMCVIQFLSGGQYFTNLTHESWLLSTYPSGNSPICFDNFREIYEVTKDFNIQSRQTTRSYLRHFIDCCLLQTCWFNVCFRNTFSRLSRTGSDTL